MIKPKCTAKAQTQVLAKLMKHDKTPKCTAKAQIQVLAKLRELDKTQMHGQSTNTSASENQGIG